MFRLKKFRDETSAANIWKPLGKKNRQEIRLVTVELSTEIEDQPVCSLLVVCLDDDRQYKALSYAWGDPKITKPVVLQVMQWHVTASLEAAFRRWCHPSQELVFWTDTICII